MRMEAEIVNGVLEIHTHLRDGFSWNGTYSFPLSNRVEVTRRNIRGLMARGYMPTYDAYMVIASSVGV